MKILVQYAHNDACAFYRTLGPYSLLAKQNPNIKVSFIAEPTYADIRAHDILVMQRPFTHELIFSAKAARDFDTKLVIDFDDDFFSIPKDNPIHSLYTEEHLKNVEMSFQLADLVTVSTKHLRREYLKFHKTIEVLPNAIDDSLIKFSASGAKRPDNDPLVLWRGTRTHDRDVASVAHELVNAANKNQNHKFFFLGSDPCSWDVSEKIKNVDRYLHPMDPVMFYQTIININPNIIIAPLADNSFNRSKSNIAALEGLLADAMPLAPDWEEWRVLDIAVYSKPLDFGFQLEALMKEDKAKLRVRAKESFQSALEQFSLIKINKRRLEILYGLL